jgi:ankyrin repeat protein
VKYLFNREVKGLFRAADWGDLAAAKKRLGSSRLLNADLAGKDGETVLMRAAAYGRCGIAELLLAGGARIESRDAKGRTALHYALEGWGAGRGHTMTTEPEETDFPQHEAVVKLLLKHGAAPNARTKEGGTPLMLALACATHYPAQALLDGGAAPDLCDPRDARRLTPLMRAAQLDLPGITRVLLDCGADPAAVTSDGKNALELVLEHYDNYESAARNNRTIVLLSEALSAKQQRPAPRLRLNL